MTKHSNISASGVNAVQGIIINDFNWIFRAETQEDIGVDGQIEVKEQDIGTNNRFAVQIKTGEGHFHKEKKGLTYYIEDKHYNYWVKGNLPVLIIAHIPTNKGTYWEYLQPSKIVKTKKKRKILIPYSQPLEPRFGDQFKEIINKHKGSLLLVKPTIKTLYELVKDEGTVNDVQIEKILSFLLSSRKKIENIYVALGQLKNSTKNTEEKKIVDKINRILRNREIQSKYKEQRTPPADVLVKYNALLKRIKDSESTPLSDQCRIYAGLIYLLKPFKSNDHVLQQNIASLGIDTNIQDKIQAMLIKYDFILKIGDILILDNQNLGKYIIEDTFFSKNKAINFELIEERFYGTK